ncbi:hypothetical protein EVAR_71028_1 [Eumeta japonica]|uniref:DUF5641 domain-containing protein n=1 Tax=Eumeta variegata TaxID=151549 RepID=A0A4C1SDT8_EUMVA|nr:hypothetical protein EVAR_71028_1 [Eumeta japonica]
MDICNKSYGVILQDSPTDHFKTFQFKTVTYGTANALYLSRRCFRQLGLNCEDTQISDIILHDFYVDDLLTDDLTPLTVSHFLNGRPLTTFPVPSYNSCESHLTRYQRNEQLATDLDSMAKEYIVELQQRIKWQIPNNPLKMNALVLLKEDNLPPLKWRLGHIVSLYPGADDINRVADIKTLNGVVRRAFSKIFLFTDYAEMYSC